MKPWTKILWFRNSIKVFGRLRNKFIGNFDMGRSSWESFKAWLIFSGKWFYIYWENLVFSSLVPIFNCSEDSIYVFRRLKKFKGNSIMRKNFLESFNICLVSPEKWFSILWPSYTFLSLTPILDHFEDWFFAKFQG